MFMLKLQRFKTGNHSNNKKTDLRTVGMNNFVYLFIKIKYFKYNSKQNKSGNFTYL